MVSKTRWLDRHLEEIAIAIEESKYKGIPMGYESEMVGRTGVLNCVLYNLRVHESRKITVLDIIIIAIATPLGYIHKYVIQGVLNFVMIRSVKK